MEKKEHKLLTLFITCFKISAFTFGGGYVIIPLMRDTFVNKLKWIDENEMLDLTAIAQSSPGAIAVNASILTGFKVARLKGALISTIATVLPPFIIISIISMFYTAFRDNKYVSSAMTAMSAAVAAVVIDVVFSMILDIIKKKKLTSIFVLIISFILLEAFNLNIIILIFLAILLGIAEYRRSK